MADDSWRLASLGPEQLRLLDQRLRAARASDSKVGCAEPDSYKPEASTSKPSGRRMDFSLAFFSADGSTSQPDKYRLLLESARYADANGLAAVWTPERHFQDFGGLYPNPSILGAALAMVTNRIQIRAGSVALPLHHPVRVVEEWAVVDNLSGGRVGVSFGSGWHPQDFLLAQGSYSKRKELTFQHIQTIRDLWAGKKVRFSDPDGSEHEVSVLPRPVQPDLPIWVSIAGNPQTWIRAGQIGANVLTMIVSQPPQELSRKIRLYHEALRSNGFQPETRTVTVMLHTYLGDDDDQVKERVRDPLTRYLRSFLRQEEGLPEGAFGVLEDDKDALLHAAFERYFRARALLGTPQRCFGLVERLLDLGVGEIACLVDFGLEADVVLAGLEPLAGFQRCYEGSGLPGAAPDLAKATSVG